MADEAWKELIATKRLLIPLGVFRSKRQVIFLNKNLNKNNIFLSLMATRWLKVIH